MAEWQLSDKAAEQLSEIYSYTFATFGEVQAEAYVEGLKRTFGLIADYPGIGSSALEIKAGYRRFRFQSHYVFYTLESDFVFIRALVHARRNLRPELFE